MTNTPILSPETSSSSNSDSSSDDEYNYDTEEDSNELKKYNKFVENKEKDTNYEKNVDYEDYEDNSDDYEEEFKPYKLKYEGNLVDEQQMKTKKMKMLICLERLCKVVLVATAVFFLAYEYEQFTVSFPISCLAVFATLLLYYLRPNGYLQNLNSMNKEYTKLNKLLEEVKYANDNNSFAQYFDRFLLMKKDLDEKY